jgi:hypothetical protein
LLLVVPAEIPENTDHLKQYPGNIDVPSGGDRITMPEQSCLYFLTDHRNFSEFIDIEVVDEPSLGHLQLLDVTIIGVAGRNEERSVLILVRNQPVSKKQPGRDTVGPFGSQFHRIIIFVGELNPPSDF